MAKAVPVPGIRPKQSLATNAIRVINVRLDEVLSWRVALEDPACVEQLHDMRIAAKRLRYSLEMFEVCYADSKPLLKELTDLQEDLGDIHDLDVLTDLLRGRLAALDTPLEDEATGIMATETSSAEKSKQLRRVLSARARDPRRLGLLALIGSKVVDRRNRYNSFQQRWGGGQLDQFAERVRTAIAPSLPEQKTESVAAGQ